MILQFKNRVSFSNLGEISYIIADLHGNGVNFAEIMDLICEMPLKRGYKRAVSECKTDIINGENLYNSFKKHNDVFPELFLEMILIGEESGNLTKVMLEVSNYYKRADGARKEFKKAMIYPLTVMVVTIVLFLAFTFLILPTFSDLFVNGNNGFLNGLMSFRGYVLNDTYNFLVYFLCWGTLLILAFKYLKKKYGRVVLKRFKFYNERIEYLVILLLNIIFSSGVNIQKGLGFYNDQKDVLLLTETMDELSTYVYKGYKIYDSLRLTGVFSKYSLAIIKVGEEGGMLDKKIAELAKTLDKKNSERLEILLKQLNPALIVITGIIVGIVLVNFIDQLLSMMYGGVGLN